MQILFGIEDYTNEGLKKVKKNITIEQAKSAVNFAKKYKIKTSTNWIIGFPTHKRLSDLENLVDTALKIGSNYAMFSILQLLPGCEMFEEAVEEGIINRDAWREYVLNPTPSYQIEFYDKFLSGKELSMFYTKAYKRYYHRPIYIIRNIFGIRSFSELRNKMPVAIKILLTGGKKY